MGSKSSSSSSSSSDNDIDYHAEWKSHSSCSCQDTDKKVKEVQWVSVPMCSTGKRVGMGIGRGFADAFSLGLAEIAFRGQRYSHDVVQVKIVCDNCESYYWYTLDFRTNGRNKYCGIHQYYSPVDGVETYYPSDMNYDDLCWIYDEVWKNKTYKWNKSNCKDYAECLFDSIKSFHRSSSKRTFTNYS